MNQPLEHHPVLHLLVAPQTLHQKFAEAIQDSADPFVVWRRETGNLRLLDCDTALYEALRSALPTSRSVHVWHGQQPFSEKQLRIHLGENYRDLARHLVWSHYRPGDAEKNETEWLSLWLQLVQYWSRPDESDIRTWLISGGTEEPAWQGLTPEQTATGRAALSDWAEPHLKPILECLIDDDEASRSPSRDVAADELDSDGDQTPAIPENLGLQQQAPHSPEETQSANEDEYRAVAYAATRTASPSAKTRVLELLPDGQNQWLTHANQWRAGTGEGMGLSQDAGRVVLELDAAAQLTVKMTPPAAANRAEGGRWRLWLYPARHAAVPFVVDGDAGQGLLRMKRVASPLGPSDADLWADLARGDGASLERISEAIST